ncbi:MAG: ankyrin repeat domain-containing protein [Gemmatimonadota bacterium]|nr:ankyrin repeat domain-containing protein [Gemmatimonadota bacterium]
MSRTLPERAHLEFLTKESKDFLKAVKAGDAAARERLRTWGPAGAHTAPKLADCQHALAREYGFPSWPKLRAHVEAMAATDPMAALAAALKSREARAVAAVLERFPSLKGRLNEPVAGGSFGATALIVAVGQGNRELVELLLANGADINQRSHWWAGGFHVLEDDHGLADFLIERGAVLDAKSAAQLGRMEELAALVAADPRSVRMRGGDGQTPLHVAPTVAIAEFLLAHGAELDARDVDHESTPAQYLVRSHTDVARYLVERGAQADIMLAAALGDIERVRGFLDADPGAIRTVVSEQYFPKRNFHAGGHIYTWTLGAGKSPHAVAREFGHEGVYRLLLERTPEPLRLALACEAGDEATVTALVASRPDLSKALSEEERRKLPLAAEQNNTLAVRLLLAAGWPVDATGRHGGTALHWAGFHGNAEMVRVILQHRPPLEARDKDFGGQTPLQWTAYGSVNGWYAGRGDYAGVQELLVGAGAKRSE